MRSARNFAIGSAVFCQTSAVGSNARSRVELLPHRWIGCVAIGRRSLVSWIGHPFRRSFGWIVFQARILFRKEGRRKRYAPLFLQPHSSTSWANSADLYDRFGHFYRVDVRCLEIVTVGVAVFCLVDKKLNRRKEFWEKVSLVLSLLKKFIWIRHLVQVYLWYS